MDNMETTEVKLLRPHKYSFNLRRLRLSLKFRPEILKLILKLRHKIRKKNNLLNTLKNQLKQQVYSQTKTCTATQTEDYQQRNTEYTANAGEHHYQNSFTQTEDSIQSSEANTKQTDDDTAKVDSVENSNLEPTKEANVVSDKNGWNLNSENGKSEKSIVEQVTEAAQSAMQQSGMVYVESAGMYYDYKTGYYYSAELGLYYHPDTGCYYHYSEDKKTFEFHSYPDRSKTATNALYEAHEKRKARKLRKARNREESDIDNLTRNLAQENQEDSEHGSNTKRRKKSKKKEIENEEDKKGQTELNSDAIEIANEQENTIIEVEKDGKSKDKNEEVVEDLEDGECSESEEEKEEKVESDESDVSVSTVSDDDDSIAKHHPPSMRVIVRETNLPKLRVGSLFLVTKDGGTVGREGSGHTILIEDSNVSRNHLDIKYDVTRRVYTVTDLGSKNGTTLNGVRISESQIVSEPVEVMHGSLLQVGETKLLCHIHPGVDTCGHCEPGLVMEMQEKEKKTAYTRTCSVQKQHQLELARLKNKYAPKPLAIEETAYNDRAKERRDKVGSSHHSEKTQSSDLDTFIAPENKGFKLLEKMGWSKGEGLGKDNQGDTEPVPLVSNDGKSGLGTAGAAAPPPVVPKFGPKNTLGPSTMRLASKTKMLQPPAKAFQDQSLDEESE